MIALVRLGISLLGAASFLVLLGGALDDAARLSTQSCNTRCQETLTDCSLACDGVIPCIRKCQAVADGCSEVCVKGGPAPSVASSAKPAPSAAPAPVEKAPAKAAPAPK